MNDRTTSVQGTLTINEVFASIQGEGKYMGRPVVFVRTCGCPVQCDFCDSKDSWSKGKQYSVNDLFQEVWRNSRQGKIRIVVITGGEPLIQHDLIPFVNVLKYEGFNTHLETSGWGEIPSNCFDHVVCSPKPALDYQIPNGRVDELKYVVGTHITDIYGMIRPAIVEKFAGRIWLQPCDEVGTAIVDNMKRCFDIAMKDPRLRVGIQLHKYIGVR